MELEREITDESVTDGFFLSSLTSVNMYVCTAELQCSAELRAGLRYTQLAGVTLGLSSLLSIPHLVKL